MNTKTMTGHVTRSNGRYFVVETDGPADLKTLELVKSQMYGAVVGDTVELKYLRNVLVRSVGRVEDPGGRIVTRPLTKRIMRSTAPSRRANQRPGRLLLSQAT